MEEMRIQKYLSEMGVMSRRAAENAVISGRVIINGEKAQIGQKVTPEFDNILVDGILINKKNMNEKNFKENKRAYIMLNKPAGIVTTLKDEQGRKCIADLLKKFDIKERIYPVGRLDMFSEGLLILTNDGTVANKLMHPKNEISKIYHVTIKGELKLAQINKLKEPLEIDGRFTSPAKVEVAELKNGRTKLKVEIFEGRNRQIRRMCENCGLIILKLKRVCEGNLNIGMLKPGEFRYLTHNEIKYLKML